MALRGWVSKHWGKKKKAPSKYSADGDSEPLSSNTKDNFIIFWDLQ